MATGTLFAPVLRSLLDELAIPRTQAEVAVIPNDFFGTAIGVAGLLTAEDIARTLAGRPLGDAVLVPAVALQEARGVFLDDRTPADLARHLGVAVEAVEASARAMLDALGARRGPARRA